MFVFMKLYINFEGRTIAFTEDANYKVWQHTM